MERRDLGFAGFEEAWHAEAILVLETFLECLQTSVSGTPDVMQVPVTIRSNAPVRDWRRNGGRLSHCSSGASPWDPMWIEEELTAEGIELMDDGEVALACC